MTHSVEDFIRQNFGSDGPSMIKGKVMPRTRFLEELAERYVKAGLRHGTSAAHAEVVNEYLADLADDLGRMIIKFNKQYPAHHRIPLFYRVFTSAVAGEYKLQSGEDMPMEFKHANH